MENMVKNFYKNKKILVTGATGFKGAWLCYWLYILGARVYGLGNNPNKNKNLFYKLKLDKKINLKLFDIRNKKKLSSLISYSKPEILFHMAAQPLIIESYLKPYLTYTVNSLGTLNVLECARKHKYLKSIICVTSDKCYESNFSTKGFKETDKLGGIDTYSGSKASAEIIVKTYFESFFKYKKCGVATARAGNVIGGGDWSENRLIPDVINSLIKKKIINIRNPNFNRPWQHVLEPIHGYLILAEKLYKDPLKYSGPWNFGTKRNTVTNVLQIVQQIIKIWGNGKIKYKKKQRYYEQANLQLNIEKSIKLIKWKPKYTIFKAIEVTTDWYKKVLIENIAVEDITNKQIKDYMNES